MKVNIYRHNKKTKYLNYEDTIIRKRTQDYDYGGR